MEKLIELWDKYRLQILVAGGLALALCYYASTTMSKPITTAGSQAVAVSSSSESSAHHLPTVVAIDIKGAVQKPGVYELKSDSRVNEAVNAAGGALASADLRQVNLAKQLTDQQMSYIPTKGETVTDPLTSSVASGELNGPASNINLNTASKEQLCQIPGIGDKKADLILQYRQEHGQFKTVDELKEINGFGEKTVAKMKEHLSV